MVGAENRGRCTSAPICS